MKKRDRDADMTCYYRIDNIEVTPQPATKVEIQMSEILATVSNASHAQLDKIVLDLFPSLFGGRIGRREKLVARRATVARMIKTRIHNAQNGAINKARRALFIGPLTIQMENGHPF